MTPERSIMTSRTAAVAIHVQQYPILEFYAIQFLDVSQTDLYYGNIQARLSDVWCYGLVQQLSKKAFI
jgi:hypothetical protein